MADVSGNIPLNTEAILLSNGMVNPIWYRFFVQLFNRTGGGVGGTVQPGTDTTEFITEFLPEDGFDLGASLASEGFDRVSAVNSLDQSTVPFVVTGGANTDDLGNSFVPVQNISCSGDDIAPAANFGWVDEATHERVALVGTDIDFSSDAPDALYKTLTANTTFTFSNPTQGKKITLRLDGNFTVTWPAGLGAILVGAYNGASINAIEIYCESESTPWYWIKVYQEAAF